MPVPSFWTKFRPFPLPFQMRLPSSGALAALLLALATALPAAAQGRWLDTFAVPGAFEGGIYGAAVNAVVPDGEGALIAGTFGLVDDVPANGVARWTGTAWEAFGSGLRRVPEPGDSDQSTAGTAYAVVRASDGSVWVAGHFDAVVQPDGSALAAAGLARWTGAAWEIPGRLDGGASISEPAGYALVAAGASVYVAGEFLDLVRPDGTALGGSGVVRWTDGVWESLGRRERTFALAALPDGRVLAPGTIATSDGNGATAVEAWDGAAAGGWQALGGGVRRDGVFSEGVFALLAEAGGAVVVGGQFAAVVEADGTERPARNVARWTGAAWETFGGPVSDGPFPVSVTSLARWQGRLAVGGDFRRIEGPAGETLDARSVAAWDGAAWSALPGLDTDAGDLAVVDGELFVSTGLASAAARWTGSTWTVLDPAQPVGGSRLAFADRTLYLSGAFEAAGGVGSPGLAAFDLDAIVAAEPVATAPQAGEIVVAPNPARGATTLRFRLDEPGRARLVLVDALGRTVAVLADGERAAGEHTVAVDTSRLPAGVYVARLDAGSDVQTTRLTVVR